MTKAYSSFILRDETKSAPAEPTTCRIHETRCNKKTLQCLDEMLATFSVDEHTKNDARHICSTFLNTDTPRKNRSRQLLVACLYIALKRERSILPFEKVCEHAQINPQHVRRIVKKVYEYCPYFLTSSIEKDNQVVLTPQYALESMVHLICEKEDLIKNNASVKMTIVNVLNRIMSASDGYLHDYQTSHLAIAIVVHCVLQNGIQMNKTEFARKYGTSHATLHKYIILLNSVLTVLCKSRVGPGAPRSCES